MAVLSTLKITNLLHKHGLVEPHLLRIEDLENLDRDNGENLGLPWTKLYHLIKTTIFPCCHKERFFKLTQFQAIFVDFFFISVAIRNRPKLFPQFLTSHILDTYHMWMAQFLFLQGVPYVLGRLQKMWLIIHLFNIFTMIRLYSITCNDS